MWNQILFYFTWSVSLLSAGRLGGVVGGDSSGHRRQELLSLLLHQTGGADDLVARRPQVRPVHLLGKVLHRDLQVRLRKEEEEEQEVVEEEEEKEKEEKK